MGPLLGIILVDYYLIARGNINVEALYHEHGELSLRRRLERERADCRGYRRGLLQRSAAPANGPAVLAGYLRLVLRRCHRRLRLLHHVAGRPGTARAR